MKNFSEAYTITPIIGARTTAAANSPMVRIDGAEDVSVFIHARFGCSNATGISATAAAWTKFSIREGTAASNAGSVITGATMTLGALTATHCAGLSKALFRVSSNLTTASILTINGITYQTTLTGVGSSGESVAMQLASAINGNASSRGLPHYRAVANYTDTGLVLVEPIDAQATGLDVVTTAAGSTFVGLLTNAAGCIELKAKSLSTNTPKYIGISYSTHGAGATAVYSVSLVRKQTYSPTFGGPVRQTT
jgi:hypothetical protein